MYRKSLASLFLVAFSLSVFAGVLSTVEASAQPTKFRIVFVERTHVEIVSIEEVDINGDGFPDFLIIEGYEEWNLIGTVGGRDWSISGYLEDVS